MGSMDGPPHRFPMDSIRTPHRVSLKSPWRLHANMWVSVKYLVAAPVHLIMVKWPHSSPCVNLHD